MLGRLLAGFLEREAAGERSDWHRTTVRKQLTATDASLNQASPLGLARARKAL